MAITQILNLVGRTHKLYEIAAATRSEPNQEKQFVIKHETYSSLFSPFLLNLYQPLSRIKTVLLLVYPT